MTLFSVFNNRWIEAVKSRSVVKNKDCCKSIRKLAWFLDIFSWNFRNYYGNSGDNDSLNRLGTPFRLMISKFSGINFLPENIDSAYLITV